MTAPSGYLQRPAPSGLADVVELVLDKGIVIDVFVRVSLLGIELLTIDARVVIASVDTYLRFAEATNRLQIHESGRTPVDLLEDAAEAAAEKVAEKVVEEKVGEVARAASELGSELLSWTPERARDLLERLTPFATRVLRYVAERGPRVPIAEVLEHFGVADRQRLERRMSSLRSGAHQVPKATDPMPADGDHYVMGPDDARVFLQAIRDRQPAARE